MPINREAAIYTTGKKNKNKNYWELIIAVGYYFSSTFKFIGNLLGPKYDGKHLQETLEHHLKDVTVKETLTDVVIPAFDIKFLQPVIFSTNVCVDMNMLCVYIYIG